MIAPVTNPVLRPVIVVTGCSSGNGLSIVSHLASAGFQVVAGLRRMEDAKRLQLISDLIFPVSLDVTDQESIESAAAIVSERFPSGIEGLVNNAGIAVGGPIESLSRSDLQHQFDVNVFGLVSVTNVFLPLLRKKLGRIINISSAASLLALPMVGAYASSKFAVEGLSDSMRRELLPSGIKVVVICPGQTATHIFEKAERASEARLKRMSQTVGYDYTPALERFRCLMHASAIHRRPPTQVATAVLKSLSARSPRRRYYVGWDAIALLMVHRFVPTAFVDWLIARKLRPDDSSSMADPGWPIGR